MLPNSPVNAEPSELVPAAFHHWNQGFIILDPVLLHQRKPLPKLTNRGSTIPALLERLKLKTNTNRHNKPPVR